MRSSLPMVDPTNSDQSTTCCTFCEETTSYSRNYIESLDLWLKEKDTLITSVQAVLELEPSEHGFILISGPAGKTTLALSILDYVEENGGYLIRGSWDQYRRPEPYQAFVIAFSELAHLILDRGQEYVECFRNLVEKEIGHETSVLTSMIPRLSTILGDASTQINPQASTSKRFVFVFRAFLKAICSPSKPILVVLDDLHYADPCSLDLFTSILSDTDIEGLVMITTCDDGVPLDSYLSNKLRLIESSNKTCTFNVTLTNLNEEDTATIIRSVFNLSDEVNISSIVEETWKYTNGNPYRLKRYLKMLESHTSCKSALVDGDAFRSFHVDSIIPKDLSADLINVLKVAACLGISINEDLLDNILQVSVAHHIQVAVQMGILIPTQTPCCYEFEHPIMQASFYELVPEDQSDLFNLEIGRRLWRALSREGVENHVFQILSHIYTGRTLVKRPKERTSVADLCLHAGLKAAKASAFRVASIYLNFGIDLLGPDGWQDEYELTLLLHNAAAEMAMCNANFAHMHRLIDAIFLHSRNFDDKIQAYGTKINALGIQKLGAEAIDVGLEALIGLGEIIPHRMITTRLLKNFLAVSKMLRGKSDEQLLRLPPMDDKNKLAVMLIMQLMFPIILRYRPYLGPFFIFRMMTLTLQFGTSAVAPFAFVAYGMLCLNVQSDVKSGYRFGELGIALLEQNGIVEYLPRVYLAFYGAIWPWKRPLLETLDPLKRGFKVGLYTGDADSAIICVILRYFFSIHAGVPLNVLENQWCMIESSMHSQEQKDLFLFQSSPCRQAVHHYMGLTSDPLSSQGDIIDWDQALRDAEKEGRTLFVCLIKSCRLRVAYMFNDLDTAISMMSRDSILRLMPQNFEIVITYFYQGMVNLADARQKRHYRKGIRRAKRYIKLFERWSKYNPYNNGDKLFLLKAELASIEGRNEDAYADYIFAISLCRTKDSNFTSMAALANERLARHLYAINNHCCAEFYFKEAITLYREWNAYRKVEYLETEMAESFSQLSSKKFPQSFHINACSPDGK